MKAKETAREKKPQTREEEKSDRERTDRAIDALYRMTRRQVPKGGFDRKRT